MGFIDRIRKIEYQLLKDLSFTPTDEQKVEMANSLLRNQLFLADNAGENISDVSSNPTSLLGTTIEWDTGNPEGDGYTITLGSFSVTQDADNPLSDVEEVASFLISGAISSIDTTANSAKVFAYRSADNYNYSTELSAGFPNALYEVEADSISATEFSYNLTISQEDTYDFVAVSWATGGDISNGMIVGIHEFININQDYSNGNFYTEEDDQRR